MKRVLDIVTPEQLAELRENGWVVVHREPTESMAKAFYAQRPPEMVNFAEGYHRAIATSIREQNA